MRMSALFDAKNCGFFKIYDVSARTREGLSRFGHWGKGSQVFAILCGRPFMDGLKLYRVKLYPDSNRFKISLLRLLPGLINHISLFRQYALF